MNEHISQLLDLSHTPYSKKKDACLVKGTSGRYYPGVRIENASFPLSIDADQAAITTALIQNDPPVGLYECGEARFPRTLSDYLKLERISSMPDPENHFRTPVIESIDDIDWQDLGRKAVVGESNFPVAAAVKTSAGWICGVNVEFPAWNLGLCAERTAIALTLSSGFRLENEICIRVFKGDFASPCGACRQVIREFGLHWRISVIHPDESGIRTTLNDLLPSSFYPELWK